MTRFNPPEDRDASTAAAFGLNELTEYAPPSEEKSSAISVTVAHIDATIYFGRYYRHRRIEELDYRSHWFKGCWFGPRMAGLGIHDPGWHRPSGSRA